MGAIQRLHRAQMGVSGGGKYIKFADPEVLRVLLANGVSSDGVGITLEDAARVTSIGTWFSGNTEITSFDEFEKFTGVTSLGFSNSSYRWAFSGCTSLETIRLPEGMTKIFNGTNNYSGVGGFWGCTSLRSVGNIGVLQEVGAFAFARCTSLEIDDLALPNLTTLDTNAFDGVKIKKVSDLGGITSLPGVSSSSQTFGDKSVLEEIVIPASITKIPAYTLYRYTALKSLAVNWGGITQIDTSAFTGVSCMPKSLTLPNLTGTLGNGAIRETNIEEILELGSITTFDSYAAYKCLLLNKVELPETITAINQQAFAYCKALKVVVCKAVTPPVIHTQAFMVASAIEAIYVPDASVDAYKAATNWATYAAQIKPMSEYNG